MFKLTTKTHVVTFTEHILCAKLEPIGGLYAVFKPGLFGPAVMYIGKAGNLDERIGSRAQCHEHWSDFVLADAMCVGVAYAQDSVLRDQVEEDLIREYCPPINTQHNALRGLPGLFAGIGRLT
jgi:hypothetical protein